MQNNFNAEFRPDLTPKQMLELGIYDGAYFTHGSTNEFPSDWFTRAKLSEKPDASLNYFGIHASQPLSVWQKKGWIHGTDPLGWFQWYCRYYMGRRIPEEDTRQIKRWKAIGRHIAQIKKNCRKGDELCRPRQRQAVLHWSYDSRRF
jgi:hypothetical protein